MLVFGVVRVAQVSAAVANGAELWREMVLAFGVVGMAQVPAAMRTGVRMWGGVEMAAATRRETRTQPWITWSGFSERGILCRRRPLTRGQSRGASIAQSVWSVVLTRTWVVRGPRLRLPRTWTSMPVIVRLMRACSRGQLRLCMLTCSLCCCSVLLLLWLFYVSVCLVECTGLLLFFQCAASTVSTVVRIGGGRQKACGGRAVGGQAVNRQSASGRWAARERWEDGGWALSGSRAGGGAAGRHVIEQSRAGGRPMMSGCGEAGRPAEMGEWRAGGRSVFGGPRVGG